MPAVAPEADEPQPGLCGEAQQVLERRFCEAREAGLTRLEARLFSESEIDVGELRHLVELGCPPAQIAAVLL